MAPPLLLAGMLLLSTPSVTVATNDASDCMAVFSSGFKRSGTTTARCKLLADFKKCNEGVDGDDTLRQVSLDLYEDKVATEPACGMTARPSIAVVDRSIRVTSEKEVLFQRYKRDEIGVFELKEYVESLQAAVEKHQTDSKSRAGSLNDGIESLGAAVSATQELLAARDKEQNNITSFVLDQLNLQDERLRSLLEAANGAVDPLLVDEAYWLAIAGAVIPKDSPARRISVLGVGFGPYFHPKFPSMFKCKFTNNANDKDIVTSDGTVSLDGDEPRDGVNRYTIDCLAPSFVKTKTVYSLDVSYVDSKGPRTIPFRGTKARNFVTYSLTWHEVSFQAGIVYIAVAGFNLQTKYACTFTLRADSKQTKTTAATFVKDNNNMLSCGKQPVFSGQPAKGTTIETFLTVSVTGSSEKALYSGSGTPGHVDLDACKNGIKDGTESDVDCGGLCSLKCASTKACKLDSDCEHGSCSQDKKCGGFSGLSEKLAGDSCKQIKRDYPKSKNGKYFIKGIKQILSHAVVVYCWMEGRVGGGWTMVLKNWYAGHQAGPWNTVGFNSPRTCDVMARRGCAYKMHDDVIRAVIGQKKDEESKFDVMQDQTGTNTYYSARNREYTVLLGYTAAWRFVRYTPMSESKTKAVFRSYYMPSDFNGKTSTGDGTINWEGQLNCGGVGGSGINCRGTKAATKGYNRRPIGGEGCKTNPSHNRWRGTLYWYMMNTNHDTYIYVCNGAQHSSGHNMNPRFWVRSGDGIE